MTTTSRNHPSTPIEADHSPVRRPRSRRAFAVLGAVAAALAVWAIAGPLAGTDLTVRFNEATQQVGPGMVIASSLLAGLAGWALLATLERIMRWSRRTWTVIAVLVLVQSLAAPISHGVHPTTIITLVGMHLAVGAVLIPALRHTARPHNQAADTSR